MVLINFIDSSGKFLEVEFDDINEGDFLIDKKTNVNRFVRYKNPSEIIELQGMSIDTICLSDKVIPPSTKVIERGGYIYEGNTWKEGKKTYYQEESEDFNLFKKILLEAQS